MSGIAMSASTLSGLTLPPYNIRIWFATVLLKRFTSLCRMNAWASWACSVVAVRPVPIAQTGS